MAPTEHNLTARGDDPEATGDAQSDAAQVAAGAIGAWRPPSATFIVRTDRKPSLWRRCALEFWRGVESAVIHGLATAGPSPNVLVTADGVGCDEVGCHAIAAWDGLNVPGTVSVRFLVILESSSADDCEVRNDGN